MSISIDVAEPQKMIDLLKQSAEVEVLSLNIDGYADYLFTDANGEAVQIEREGVGAILGNMIAIEDEIRRHMQAGRMILIMEGIVIPNPDGTAICELMGKTVRTQFFSKTRYETLAAWLWQIQEAGIEYIHTLSLQETAIAISSIYHNSQKPEHKTFKRHLKPITAWHPNKYISSLMGLTEAEIGEKRATQLVERFRTFFDVVAAPPPELEEVIGKAATKKLIKAIGRE